VGVDAAHRRVDDFESLRGELLLQHHFENAPEAESRGGRALGSGFPEDEDPKRVLLLLCRQRDRIGLRRGFAWHELPAELPVRGEGAAIFRPHEEPRRVAVTSEPQGRLNNQQKERRDENHHHKARRPFPPAGQPQPRSGAGCGRTRSRRA
jgi:hypothetical protein